MIMAACPASYFHQTLTFAKPIYDARAAKRIFNKFMKGVFKYYGNCWLALHVQERRKDGTLHYHVCFINFTPNRLPFAHSSRYRDFRTDLYQRWHNLNNGESVHRANKLIEHKYNFETISYFCGALEVAEVPPVRAETNWWGLWNKELINNCSYKPSKDEIKHWFNELFKKSKRSRTGQPDNKIKLFFEGTRQNQTEQGQDCLLGDAKN
jgi:hypothetical protein